MSSVMSRLPALTVRHPVKLTILGMSVGAALIAALALYFRRRKRRRPYRNITTFDRQQEAARGRKTGRVHPLTLKSPGADNAPSSIIRRSVTRTLSRSSSPSFAHMTRSHSSASCSTSATNETITLADLSIADSTLTDSLQYDMLTSEELCQIGLESVQHAVSYWREAMIKLQQEPENSQLQTQLRPLLERCEHMLVQYEQRISAAFQANIAVDSAVDALVKMDAVYENALSHDSIYASSRHYGSSLDGDSDLESFVSAMDLADLSDLESQLDSYTHLDFYEEGLKELEAGNVQCRSLRTSMVNCTSDTEFLAKLYCVRLAFNKLFEDSTIREWFADSSRDMIATIMVKADLDPEDFMMAYIEMMEFVMNPESQDDMESELNGRGVKCMGFYDVVIDFMMFDAFDDLEEPPSSIKAVIQNRWLSSGFKKTALSTAVWSVLRAKKQLLKYPHGFIQHFYNITEHTTPMLAWGFLGPEGPFKQLCHFFKDQVLGYMQDVFSFDKVHYTQVSQLSDDILKLSKERLSSTQEYISNCEI